MKKLELYITFAVLFVSAVAIGQQLPQYTQYFLNDYAINPAVGGSNPYWRASMNNRYQWVGIQDAPRTHVVSLHGPVRNTRVGLGGYAFADITGPTRRTGASFSYAYHLPISEDIKLSMAVSGGVLQFAMDASKITTKVSSDIALSNGNQSVTLPDAGAGLYLYSDDFFVGFSAPQLLGNRVQFFEDYSETKGRLARHFFFSAGYNFPVVDNFKLQPSVFIKYVEPTPVQFDAAIRGIYADQVWAGLSYRSEDAIGIMFGYMFQSNLSIGYSYDMPTSDIQSHTNGTHELMFGIRFRNRTEMDSRVSEEE